MPLIKPNDLVRVFKIKMKPCLNYLPNAATNSFYSRAPILMSKELKKGFTDKTRFWYFWRSPNILPIPVCGRVGRGNDADKLAGPLAENPLHKSINCSEGYIACHSTRFGVWDTWAGATSPVAKFYWDAKPWNWHSAQPCKIISSLGLGNWN